MPNSFAVADCQQTARKRSALQGCAATERSDEFRLASLARSVANVVVVNVADCRACSVFPLFLPFACLMLACSTTEEPPAQDGFGVIVSTPDGEIVGEDDRVCDDNRDCRVVDGSCCSCAQNFTATLTAINAASLDEVEARRTTLCAERPCQNAGSQSPTCCAQGAACVDLRCELVGPLDTVLGADGCE